MNCYQQLFTVSPSDFFANTNETKTQIVQCEFENNLTTFVPWILKQDTCCVYFSAKIFVCNIGRPRLVTPGLWDMINETPLYMGLIKLSSQVSLLESCYTGN